MRRPREKKKREGLLGYIGQFDCAQSLAEADSVVDTPVGMYVTVKLKSVKALIAPLAPKSWELLGHELLVEVS